MATGLSTKPMLEHLMLAVSNNFRNYCDIDHSVFRIDDDDNRWMTCRNYTLMDHKLNSNCLLKPRDLLRLIDLHNGKTNWEMKMLLMDHTEIYHLERVMEQVHVESVVLLTMEETMYLDQNKDQRTTMRLSMNFLVLLVLICID